jgi:hypothetical protein
MQEENGGSAQKKMPGGEPPGASYDSIKSYGLTDSCCFCNPLSCLFGIGVL